MVTQAIMAEEIARVCASTAVTLLISKLGMLPVMNWASEELKQAYLPRVASGEFQASYCLSEADAGSDVASMRTPGGARRRRLRPDRGQALDHQRRRVRHLHGVRRDRPRRRAAGASAASWSRPTGASRSRTHEDKMGLRGSPTAGVIFDEVRVPASHLHRRGGPGLHHRHAHPRPQPADHRRPGRRASPRGPSTAPPAT